MVGLNPTFFFLLFNFFIFPNSRKFHKNFQFFLKRFV
nr:MAG TPA: hypothetical protein [Caudoviricetes sp.]